MPGLRGLFRAHGVGDRDAEWFGDALLKLEPDNPHDRNAVGVYLEGRKVGHLSCEMARDFRQAIVRDGLADRSEFAVTARVYWGGSERHHSVSSTFRRPEGPSTSYPFAERFCGFSYFGLTHSNFRL